MALTALLLLFAMVNYQFVAISLFPLPYEIQLPKFLLAIICFGAGLIVGGLLMSVKLTQAKRIYKREHQRADALENEVRSMHSSTHVLPS
jgi:uncharacterized integral membrane protein